MLHTGRRWRYLCFEFTPNRFRFGFDHQPLADGLVLFHHFRFASRGKPYESKVGFVQGLEPLLRNTQKIRIVMIDDVIHHSLLVWGGLRRPVELPAVEDINQLDHANCVANYADPDQRRVTQQGWMLARHITREPELPDPKEPDTAHTFVFKHDAFLRMLASVRSGPSESVRRLHDSTLPRSVLNVNFGGGKPQNTGGRTPHPPDCRDGTHSPPYPRTCTNNSSFSENTGFTELDHRTYRA